MTDPFLAHDHSERSAFITLTSVIDEIGQLGLIAYILYRQGRRFLDIGLNFRPWDLAIAVPIYAVGFAARRLLQDFAARLLKQPTDHAGLWTMLCYGFSYDWHVSHAYFFTTLFLGVLNPFTEELIVRAYLMTEIRALTGSVPLAVVASTLFQTSYHFYEGILPPIGHLAMFFVFSLFFAKTKRIMPVIFAHMFADILPIA